MPPMPASERLSLCISLKVGYVTMSLDVQPTSRPRAGGGGEIRRVRTLGHVRGYKGDACSRILLKGLDFGDVQEILGATGS